MPVDTHSHLYAPEFDTDREEALQRAIEAGVERLYLPAIDSESHQPMFDLCRRHPDRCVPMMGLHPTSVNDNPNWRDELDLVERYLQQPPEGIARWCGVGEIGLDLYWSRDWRKEQIEVFTRQLEWSLAYHLPVAIHVRDAWEETLEVIRGFQGRGLRGVFHAFSGDEACWQELRTLGDFRFGVGGVVTFKKRSTADVIRIIPTEELVLETDCPYLTPVPHRGERNESAYVHYVCAKVAEIKGLTYDEVAAITTHQAELLFGKTFE